MALQESDLEAFKDSYINYRFRMSEIAKNRFLGYFLTSETYNKTVRDYPFITRVHRRKEDLKNKTPKILTEEEKKKRIKKILKNFEKYYGDNRNFRKKRKR